MSSNRRVCITTIDNPFDPFDQFIEWFNYDESCGYHTCSLIDNITFSSSAFSNEEENEEIERAIDELIRIEGDSFYKKIIREE